MNMRRKTPKKKKSATASTKNSPYKEARRPATIVKQRGSNLFKSSKRKSTKLA